METRRHFFKGEVGGCSGPVGLFFIFAALKPEPALEKSLASVS